MVDTITRHLETAQFSEDSIVEEAVAAEEFAGAETGAEKTQPLMRRIEAQPQMEFRKTLQRGKLYRMAVLLNQKGAAEGSISEKFIASVPENLRQLAIDVQLDCSSHFRLSEVSEPCRVTFDVEPGRATK